VFEKEGNAKPNMEAGPVVFTIAATGRGLHSSTFKLNQSRFGHTSPCPPV